MSKPFSVREFIRKQRDGEDLPDEDLVRFVHGVVDGSVSEAQLAAFSMAVFQRGMSGGEVVLLTKAMRDSGDILQWDVNGPLLDRHSTGAVADASSLIIAPLLAACGAYVPMTVNSSTYHTSGSLDKLGAIPGYQTTPDTGLIQATVRDTGCVIIGGSSNIAPAEHTLSKVRKETSTLENQSLMVASTIAKKLAVGVKSVVFDVKAGNGTFMASYGEARKLCTKFSDVARACNLNASALISDMNQPLSDTAGNALEILQCIDFLNGKKRDPRMLENLFAAGTELLIHGELAKDKTQAEAKMQDALDSGAAAERFAKMVASLGGPNDFIEKAETHLPSAKIIRPVPSPRSGYIHAINTQSIGELINWLNRKTASSCDHSAGLTGLLHISDKIAEGDPLAIVHAPDEDSWKLSADIINSAYHIANVSIQANDVILDTIRPSRL